MSKKTVIFKMTVDESVSLSDISKALNGLPGASVEAINVSIHGKHIHSVGDLVKFKNGTTLMNIDSLPGNGTAYCVWSNEQGGQIGQFVLEDLIPVMTTGEISKAA